MTVIEKAKATEALNVYTDEIHNGPIVITDQGRPIALLMSIENVDLETLALSTSQRFIELIERSRSRVHGEGTISSQEVRQRLLGTGRPVAKRNSGAKSKVMKTSTSRSR